MLTNLWVARVENRYVTGKAMASVDKHVHFPMLSSAVCALIKLPPRAMPSWFLLARLALAWRCSHGQKNPKYLRRISRLAHETRGPIMECGSGLTTLLLGLLCEKTGKQVYTLEHREDAIEFMSLWLKRFHITNITIQHAPLMSYADYHWYNIDKDELPDNFSLVICEALGHPAPRSHYGLLPVMGDRLAMDCRVILADTLREKDPTVLREWRKFREVSRAPFGRFRPFTEVALL